jgi:hypothetical protein
VKAREEAGGGWRRRRRLVRLTLRSLEGTPWQSAIAWHLPSAKFNRLFPSYTALIYPFAQCACASPSTGDGGWSYNCSLTVNSEVFARFGMMSDTPQISEVPRAMTTQQGRKPTPRSAQIITHPNVMTMLRDATDTTLLHSRGHFFHGSFRGKGTPVPPRPACAFGFNPPHAESASKLNRLAY